MRSRGVEREVVGGADHLRTEARAGPVGGAGVVWSADDYRVGAFELAGWSRSQASTPRKVTSGPYMPPMRVMARASSQIAQT